VIPTLLSWILLDPTRVAFSSFPMAFPCRVTPTPALLPAPPPTPAPKPASVPPAAVAIRPPLVTPMTVVAAAGDCEGLG